MLHWMLLNDFWGVKEISILHFLSNSIQDFILIHLVDKRYKFLHSDELVVFSVNSVEVLIEVFFTLWDLLDFKITSEQSLKFCSVYLPILLYVCIVKELLQCKKIRSPCLFEFGWLNDGGEIVVLLDEEIIVYLQV